MVHVLEDAVDCVGELIGFVKINEVPEVTAAFTASKAVLNVLADGCVDISSCRFIITEGSIGDIQIGIVEINFSCTQRSSVSNILIDIVDAGTKYNIFEYQRDFEKAYKDIVDRGGIPILCGGSGLYIEAATCGYSLPEVPANPQLREELEKKSDEELIAQLASLKPLHNSTDYDTRKRLIRALEIAIYEAEHPVQRTAFLPKKTYYIGIF